MGRDAKDVSREEALDYVAGYTCGNDVSSRKLQRNPELAGNVPQWGFSKGFDTYAPLGPCIVSTEIVSNPADLHMKTIIDGETRQSESVSDLLFDCAHIISYLSQGTTIQKGQVIMTGTPGGESSFLSLMVLPALRLRYRFANLVCLMLRCWVWDETCDLPEARQ